MSKNKTKKKERKTVTTSTKHAKGKSWKGIVLAQDLDSVHHGERGRCLGEGTAGDPGLGLPTLSQLQRQEAETVKC